MSAFVRDVLLCPSAAVRQYVEAKALADVVESHIRGTANWTTEIHKLLTLELIHRTLLEGKAPGTVHLDLDLTKGVGVPDHRDLRCLPRSSRCSTSSIPMNERLGTSPALWIAVAWMFLGASRMVSQWLRFDVSPDIYTEGSAIDRNILTVLLVAGVLVLISRGHRTTAVLRANGPMLLFFGYCLCSVLWSDFPLVALKRWTKAAGNLTVVLLVVTDPKPAAAVRRLFAWTGFLLIPVSVLLVKYYPDLGRGYSPYVWTTYYVGAATDKNGLGVICMVFGLAAFWRLFELFRARPRPLPVRPLMAHGILLLMALWLFRLAESATSLVCFMLGVLLIIVTFRAQQKPSADLRWVMGTLILFGVFGYAFPELYEFGISKLGRNATLTGRTDVWTDVLNMRFNAWVGTGFESFWLGPRLEFLWSKYYFQPNQAHNGYLETYLNLGVLGLGLLAS